MHQRGQRVRTGNGDSRCDVTGLNWNLKVNLLHVLQREEKGHDVPADWAHPKFSVPGSALVEQGPFLSLPAEDREFSQGQPMKMTDNSCPRLSVVINPDP